MAKDKDKTELVERLQRIFPDLTMFYEATHEDDESHCPSDPIDFYEFLATLDENGLCITNKKEVK